MIPRSTKSRVGPLDPEDPSLSWSEELPPITAEGKSLSSRGVFLPPLKLALTPITESKAENVPFLADNTVTSSLETAEDANEVDADAKGKRFLKNHNSWVFSEPPSATEGKDGFTLLSYLESLSLTDDIDFTVLEQLLEGGENINTLSESMGQCIMHEVAANWDQSVAEFFLKKGSDIHLKDKEGKTPLHVAASTGHTDMVEWLIENGAELEPRTIIERQTPLHHAARYDAVQAMGILIEHGGDCEVRDYKGRTPLHLAAELDRTAAAEYLISVPISAEVRVQDDHGNHAIASMIRTMPRVALLALDQLHRIAPAKRKQYYLLNHLEPEPGSDSSRGVKTPFEIAVEEKRHNILSHPVMQTLITEKWRFVKWFFYGHLTLYFTFLISWSLLITYPSVQEKHHYIFPRDTWRVIAQVFAISTYIFQIVEEIFELLSSKLKYKYHKELRTKILQDDIKNLPSHLMEEKEFLNGQINHLKKSTSNYFRDPWNIIDLITYVMILILVLLHISDISFHSSTLALWVARVSCFVLILIWIRLFKHARGFRSLGPLVAIVHQLIGDILHYFTLYAIVFVPYVLCFWVLFGGKQSASLTNAENQDLTVFYRVAIAMFRMSLIDEYPYNSFRSIDEAMAAILVITFLLFLAVVGLNLFIALLSDTFQRVYDNAQAIAILQQANLILSYEEKMCPCLIERYRAHIHNKCNPKSEFFDDDDFNPDSSKEVKKVAHQIHDIVSELHANQSENIGERNDQLLSEHIEQQDSKLEQIIEQLDEIKVLLLGKTHKRSKPGSSSPEHHPKQYGQTTAAKHQRPQHPPPHPTKTKQQQSYESPKPSSEPQVSPTRQALIQLSNQRQRKIRQAAGKRNYPSVAKLRTSAPEQSYQSLLPGQTDAMASDVSAVSEPDTGPSQIPPALFSQCSIPGRPGQSGQVPFLLTSSTLPPGLQSHLSISNQIPTPPIISGHQQPFFSQLSVLSGGSQHDHDSYKYNRTDSFALQLGHRRMRKISRSDLEKMQWEKKQQPARKMT